MEGVLSQSYLSNPLTYQGMDEVDNLFRSGYHCSMQVTTAMPVKPAQRPDNRPTKESRWLFCHGFVDALEAPGWLKRPGHLAVGNRGDAVYFQGLCLGKFLGWITGGEV